MFLLQPSHSVRVNSSEVAALNMGCGMSWESVIAATSLVGYIDPSDVSQFEQYANSVVLCLVG